MSERLSRTVAWLLLGFAVLASQGSAAAQGPSSAGQDPVTASARSRSAPVSRERPRVEIAVGSHVPTSVGGDITGDLLPWFFLRLHAGFMPAGYFDAVDAVVRAIQGEGGKSQTWIAKTLRDAMIARLTFGFRPLRDSPFELGLGYTVMTTTDGSGSIGPSGTDPAVDFQTAWNLMKVAATAHAIHAHVGGRWLMGDHWFMRIAFGWTHILAAQGRVKIPRNIGLTAERVEREIEEKLRSRGYAPDIQLLIGYRL